MKPIFTLSFFLLTMAVAAQTDSLYYRNVLFSLYPRIYNSGNRLQHEEAQALFKKVPVALQAYNQSRMQTKIGFYSLAGSVVCLGASSIGFDNGNRALMATGLLLSVGSFINSIVFSSVAEFRLRRAIRVYNKASLQ